MAALLASTPSLEVLSVTHLWFDVPQPRSAWPVTIPERVTLPHLKTLQVVQSALEAATLLRIIPMPSFALSVSLQSSEPLVNVPLHLGTYHTKVYEVCAAFARSTHQPECLQKGVQKFGSVLSYKVASEFIISGSYHLNDRGHRPEQPKLHLSFNYDASHFHHPLLNSIETLHLLRNRYHRNYSNISDFDWEIGTKHVRLGVEIEAFVTDLRERGLASLPEHGEPTTWWVSPMGYLVDTPHGDRGSHQKIRWSPPKLVFHFSSHTHQ
jgi:hypothetical protein